MLIICSNYRIITPYYHTAFTLMVSTKRMKFYINKFQYFTDRRRKRDFETERPDLSYLVGVRKGSVIGVYLDTNNPIQAIGETSNSNNNGVCRTTVSVSAMIIDCSNGSNVQDQILHAEAKISK